MMKGIVMAFFVLFFLNQRAFTQLNARPAVELTSLLQQDIADTIRVQTLLQLVLYYYFDHNEVNPDAGKMLLYLQQTEQANKTVYADVWQVELDCYWGKYFSLTGNKEKASEYFEKMKSDIAARGDLAAQIKSWRKLGVNIRELDTIGLTRNDSFLKLMAIYKKNGDKESVIEMEKAIADTHLKQGNLDIAETEMFAVLDHYKEIRYRNLHYTYNLLSYIYSFKGNYNKALYYALLTIESMRNNVDTVDIVNYYCQLANMYYVLGQYEKSAESFGIAFNREFVNPIEFYSLRDAGMYARVLAKQNKMPQALQFIKNFIKKYPPVDTYGKASLARTLAWYYRSNGNLTASEKYIREMIAMAPLLLKNNEITEEVEYDLGSYFLEKRDFTAASVHFKHALAEASYVNNALRKKDVYLMLFETDSSLGNYVVAIQHLNQYRRLNDSIFTVTKNRQVQEVQVKYETEKKDRELSIKDKNIQLLTRQSQLQLANLNSEKKTRNLVLVCTGMLVLLLTLGYNRYKLKQRSNLQLEQQQMDIKEKNVYLQRLLEEKEWLVKEIHHRVKNNFHTVIGLLGTQSEFLRNGEAIAAITTSQQRIQAMSLIHQKLYQSENMSHIEMVPYIHELVDYLKDSLNTDRRIQFHFKLDRLDLGVYHAVPIGLILNETITNAIKYAFPENRKGNIYISFTSDPGNENGYLLSVTDNGIGLPVDFDNNSTATMGMNLMKGLARDIDGEFSIRSTTGTTIKIAFTYYEDITKNESMTVKETNQIV